jgi:hypothetical protein
MIHEWHSLARPLYYNIAVLDLCRAKLNYKGCTS